MSTLAQEHCRPGAPRLTDAQADALLAELAPGWALDGQVLARDWRFADFSAALAFVNRVGALADAQDHHPDVTLRWGHAGLRIWTHDAGGLTRNDFILAAHVDALGAA